MTASIHILRTPLSAMDQMVLRNVIDDDRMRGVTLANQAEHDAAVLELLRRGLLRYNRFRTRQKFNVTQAGLQQLRLYEGKVNGTAVAP